jgi:hypothetical protein
LTNSNRYYRRVQIQNLMWVFLTKVFRDPKGSLFLCL